MSCFNASGGFAANKNEPPDIKITQDSLAIVINVI